MNEFHRYESCFHFSSHKIDCQGFYDFLIDKFRKDDNFDGLSGLISKIDGLELNNYHHNGISIYLQTEKEDNVMDYLDIMLLSHVTPTKKLEDEIRELSENYSREE